MAILYKITGFFGFSHKGERCFLIGNGPSLRISDLEALQENGEITFGCNLVIKIPDLSLVLIQIIHEKDHWPLQIPIIEHRGRIRLDKSKKEDIILETGYPRNDALFTFTEEDVQRIREEIGVPDQNQPLLYTGTPHPF